jgi:hypothetical protein
LLAVSCKTSSELRKQQLVSAIINGLMIAARTPLVTKCGMKAFDDVDVKESNK